MKCYYCENIAKHKEVVTLHQYIRKTIDICEIHYQDRSKRPTINDFKNIDDIWATQTTFE